MSILNTQDMVVVVNMTHGIYFGLTSASMRLRILLEKTNVLVSKVEL
jgi:hypothetical protein